MNPFNMLVAGNTPNSITSVAALAQNNRRAVAVAPPPVDPHANVLRIAREINRAALAAQVPAALIVQTFVKDEQQRKAIMSVLNAIQAGTAAPGIISDISTGMDAAKRGPALPAALDTAKAVGMEAGLQALPHGVQMLLSYLK